ncbi:MAG: CusA/CzcA family heavy metal efflux RND transporter [Muribaculaceae bacterium]|nr:CusA/CzcA family heavy metal efflux RND transporter [Muribaculaceae bacterium]
MLNRIIKFSLDNRITVLILSAVILFCGMIITLRSDVDIFPDLNAPTVVVMTEAPGMTAQEVETTVTYPIETAVNGSTGVRRVRSTSTAGFSTVWIEFDWDTEILQARQIVSERLSSVSENMPAGVEAPVLGPQSSILGEMMIIGLQSDSIPLMEIRDIAERILKPRLLALNGVSAISVIGGERKEMQIQLHPDLMKQRNVSVNEVLEALDNINNNVTGGVVYDYGNEYLIRGQFSSRNTEDISTALIKNDDNGMVRVEDVATVTIAGAQPQLGLAALNGSPAVLMTITKQPHASTIKLTEEIMHTLESEKHSLPGSLVINTDIFRQADFIDNSISNLGEALFEGAIFVILILFIFMMNIRATAVSVIALPLSIIITIIILHALGFTINTMSLGGIAIAIGSLVDDAIVDVENVYRRLRLNRKLPESERQSVRDVVFSASAEVRMPIFNSTLIITAGFLPLFFLSGFEGRLLIPLGVAFIVALAASTLVALTLTPVLSSFLLNKGDESSHESKLPWTSRILQKGYIHSLERVMQHKTTLLIVTGALFIIACILFSSLGRSFLPRFNEGSFTINVSTLPGVSLYESDKVASIADSIIMSMPEIKTVARKTGRAELDEHSLGVQTSEIEAPYILDKRSRAELATDLRQRLSQIPGVNVEIGQPISHRIDAMLSGTEAQVAIKIFGSDLTELYRLAQQIKQIASGIEGIEDVNIEQQVERPELSIIPRREVLAARGLTLSSFRQTLNTLLSGSTISQMYENGQPYDVVVVAYPEARNSLTDIMDMPISTPTGMASLSELAEIKSVTGPNSVSRENVNRRIIISANIEGRDLRGSVNELAQKINASVKLPEDYYISYGGQFENEAAASNTLIWASLGALLIIFMLLYHQFKNIKQSLVILVNMPLALIGGIMILFFTGAEVNIPAIIGFISLIGIATRNGMLLMSHYNTLEAEGMPLMERIFTGSRDRLLPIIMTALTSALALIPLAITGDKPGNEIQSPLAVVILGGLISSTILNMYVVPALYYLLYNKKQK